jgi:RNA polymerase sigma-70 factor (ECF subfamily)
MMDGVRSVPRVVVVEANVDRPQAFEEFFEVEQERLLRVLSVITGSRAEAEDIAQDAFVKVWERWEDICEMDDPAGYLHKTAMNLFRSRYRRMRLAVNKALGAPPIEDVFGVVEDREAAVRGLASLSPRQRAAIVLTEGLGYSAEQAGTLLGIRGSTVRALHFQGREALKRAREQIDV